MNRRPPRSVGIIGGRAIPSPVTPRDRELMEGMGNCYAACGASFPETLRMVAGTRHRDPAEVAEALRRIARESAQDPEYRALRDRVPTEFPF